MVVTVSMVVAAPPLGVTDAGEKLQAAPAGRPEQEKATAELKPVPGATVRVKLADCPAFMVAVLGAELNVKSPAGGVGAKGRTVSVRTDDTALGKIPSPPYNA